MKLADDILRIGYGCVWILAMMMGVVYGIGFANADMGSEEQNYFLTKTLWCGLIWLIGLLMHAHLIRQKQEEANGEAD